MKIDPTVQSSESGATSVELTFSLMAFLVFVIVTVEAGIIGYRTLTAQYIASQTAREAALFAGNAGAGGINIIRTQRYSFNLARRMGLGKISSEAAWRANNVQVCRIIDVVSFSDNRCRFGNNLGTDEDFISVRIVIPSRFFLQSMRIDVVGWGVARNEPF